MLCITFMEFVFGACSLKGMHYFFIFFTFILPFDLFFHQINPRSPYPFFSPSGCGFYTCLKKEAKREDENRYESLLY